MKARVKATGEIVDIAEYSTIYAENYDTCFYPNELEFLDNSEDYWTRLEHQAAIGAMQGILSNSEYLRSLMHTKHDDYRAHEVVPSVAMRLSHALVEKLKEKEE